MKQGHVRGSAAAVQVFPRIRAGASLKQPLVVVRAAEVVPVFPRIRAGASLKRIGEVVGDHDAYEFSPAFVRGPH